MPILKLNKEFPNLSDKTNDKIPNSTSHTNLKIKSIIFENGYGYEYFSEITLLFKTELGEELLKKNLGLYANKFTNPKNLKLDINDIDFVLNNSNIVIEAISNKPFNFNIDYVCHNG